jgi:D-glycero-D-manno-heptose 1,7-bisphosphate phosphatase
MNKAIFLDRDGVINEERGEYTYRLNDFVFVPGLFEALQKWKAKGYLFVVITNQSGIAKGVYSHEDLDKIHHYMLTEFEKQGIPVEEIYYSPHHPDTGKSISRKPDSLLVEKALARFDIDPAASYFIGDKERDIEAAQKAGVKGILVESNQSLLTILDKIK